MMIKRVKELDPSASIAREDFRDFVEKMESEILRGISNLAALSIIDKHNQEGIHGYQLLQDLKNQTNDMLIIEEGTLYPLLRKLEKRGVIQGEKVRVDNRPRKYYRLTPDGTRIFNHMSGFFSKLMEAMAPLVDIDVALFQDRFLYCPNCANKIDLATDAKFCEICGLNIQEYKKRRQD